MFLSRFWHLSRVFERAEETWRFWTFVWLKATKAQERQLEFTGSAKIACAKGLFAGETGLVGFCVVWTREELGFISLEGFLLSLGFLDSKGS